MNEELTYAKDLLRPFNPLFSVISDVAYERFEDVYVVGGFVRDLILNRANNDIDFVVVGDSLGFAQDLAKELGIPDSEVVVFKTFGTAHFKYQDTDLEFVMARKESYNKYSRKPEVKLGTLEDDLDRRDFTCNAMAISLNRTSYGDLVDPHEGLLALSQKHLKTPISAKTTFNDDPLRIMRMCRFAAQLDFIPDTMDLYDAAEMIERLSIVSQERISTELLKILSSPNPAIGLRLLQAVGALEVFLPEISVLDETEQREEFHHKNVFNHTLEVVEKISKLTDNVWVRLAALFHDIGKPKSKAFVEGKGWTFYSHEDYGKEMVAPLFERLKLPFEHIPLVETLVWLHGRFRGLESSEKVNKAAARRLIALAGPYMEELILLYKCDFSSKKPEWVKKMEITNARALERIRAAMEEDEDSLVQFKCNLSGHKIMKMLGMKPGKEVGIVKGVLEAAVLEGVAENTEEALSEFLTKNDGIIKDAISGNLLFKKELPDAEEISKKILGTLLEN